MRLAEQTPDNYKMRYLMNDTDTVMFTLSCSSFTIIVLLLWCRHSYSLIVCVCTPLILC